MISGYTKNVTAIIKDSCEQVFEMKCGRRKVNNLKKKTVLVTGASRGIGKSIAIGFAKEGYHVFVNCRKSIDDLQKLTNMINVMTPGSATMVPGNVADPARVREMFKIIDSQCDGLDVLVNNAGISFFGLLSDMTDEEWDEIISVNLSSVFYCCRQAIPAMVSRKAGKIINISSIWGRTGASCESAYSAAKSGVNGLTMALAKELAPSNISVNAIACGVVDTEMNGHLTEAEKEQLANEIPVGRFATADEIAKLVIGMVNSPNYMTGQIIGIDGGFI